MQGRKIKNIKLIGLKVYLNLVVMVWNHDFSNYVISKIFSK